MYRDSVFTCVRNRLKGGVDFTGGRFAIRRPATRSHELLSVRKFRTVIIIGGCVCFSSTALFRCARSEREPSGFEFISFTEEVSDRMFWE